MSKIFFARKGSTRNDAMVTKRDLQETRLVFQFSTLIRPDHKALLVWSAELCLQSLVSVGAHMHIYLSLQSRTEKFLSEKRSRIEQTKRIGLEIMHQKHKLLEAMDKMRITKNFNKSEDL